MNNNNKIFLAHVGEDYATIEINCHDFDINFKMLVQLYLTENLLISDDIDLKELDTFINELI